MNPVSDSTKDDFCHGGRGTQTISVLSVEALKAPLAPAPFMPANEFSNLDLQSGRPISVTVILLDRMNPQFYRSGAGERPPHKISKQIHPNDRVALYTAGRSLA